MEIRDKIVNQLKKKLRIFVGMGQLLGDAIGNESCFPIFICPQYKGNYELSLFFIKKITKMKEVWE